MAKQNNKKKKIAPPRQSKQQFPRKEVLASQIINLNAQIQRDTAKLQRLNETYRKMKEFEIKKLLEQTMRLNDATEKDIKEWRNRDEE